MSDRSGLRSAYEDVDIQARMRWAVSSGSVWLLGVSAIVFLAYWPTTASLFRLWADTDLTTYTHGYFVLAIVGWLLARTSQPISSPATGERIVAGILLFLATALWLVVYNASLQLVHELLLPPIAALAIWMMLGRKMLVASLFPLGYLYFAMSAWDFLNPVLQSISVGAVRFLLRGLGFTTYFEGNVIHIPSGAFEIAGGCSGLHFFIVAIAIAALYGEMGRDSWRVRLILVTSAAVLAILMNWVRITTIVLAGYYTDMQHYLVQKDHYTFGWILFGVFIAVFFAGCQRWLPPVTARDPGPAPSRSPHQPQRFYGPLTVLACLLVVPASNMWLTPEVDGENFAGLSGAAADWAESPLPASQWTPEFPGADRITQQYFASDAGKVEVIAAFYAHQSQGKEIVGHGTSLTGRSAVTTSMPEPASNSRWNEWTLKDASGTWLVWHSYRVGPAWYRNGFRQQLAYGWRSIFAATPSIAILVRSACTADCGQARDDVAAYVGALEDGIERRGELR